MIPVVSKNNNTQILKKNKITYSAMLPQLVLFVKSYEPVCS